MRFIHVFFILMFLQGWFVVTAFKNGFHEASEIWTSKIGSLVLVGILAAVGYAAFKIYQHMGCKSVRKTEGTLDISNDKFVERVIAKATEISREGNPDLDVHFHFIEESTIGEQGERQQFFYKLSNAEVNAQEEATGQSYGFRFVLAKNYVSPCDIDTVRGMNDKMDSTSKFKTASVEQAGSFIASKSKRITEQASRRNAKHSKSAAA